MTVFTIHNSRIAEDLVRYNKIGDTVTLRVTETAFILGVKTVDLAVEKVERL